MKAAIKSLEEHRKYVKESISVSENQYDYFKKQLELCSDNLLKLESELKDIDQALNKLHCY